MGAFLRLWNGEMKTPGRTVGQGNRRGMTFGRIFMLSVAFRTERGRQEGGEREKGTGGDGIWDHFNAFERIWDG